MEENENITINEQDTYENADVQALQEMQARFDAELAKRDQKYSALLKYVAEGGNGSAEQPSDPIPTEEERFEDLKNKALDFRSGKLNCLEKAKVLIEFDNWEREHGRRSIFAVPDGTLSQDFADMADRGRELQEYCIEVADGNPEVYQATYASKQ